MDGNTLSRRQFITTSVSAAGGLVIGLGYPGLANALAINPQPWSKD